MELYLTSNATGSFHTNSCSKLSILLRRSCCVHDHAWTIQPLAALGILFRGFIKNFNKKGTWIYQFIDKIIIIIIIIHEVLQFSSTSIQILNYEYLLPMWIGVWAYNHFILLSLSNIFIFMQFLLSICYCFYKNILKDRKSVV